ncbi:MAG: DUF6602 domain-containing protein [Marinicellaceae bacterium]
MKIVARKLVINLEEIKSSHIHKGVRGTSSEVVFRNFLKEYLPPDNRIGEGEVIDLNNQTSKQLDVIITNSYHPYLNDLKEPGLFIIEGVSCAGEVKTNLASKDIVKLIESCIAFKKLTPKISKGTQISSNPSDIERFVQHRPYFVFAYKSQLKIETIQSQLIDYYNVNNIPISNQIDAVFCLDRGSIINFGDGKGSLKYKTQAQNSIPGFNMTSTNGSDSLIQLISWLSVSIKNLAFSSPPIIPYLINNIQE